MNLLKITTPNNLLEEKQRFLISPNYHPVFHYDWEGKGIISNRDFLKDTLFQSILSQDIDAIQQTAYNLFEVSPAWPYKNIAEKIVSVIPHIDSDRRVEDFVNRFNEAFRLFKLDDYSVEVVDKRGFNFRPSPKNKKIIMSRHADFQFFNVEGEVRHEMVHILRYENGKFNKIKRADNYLPTEEGLATFMHDTSVGGESAKFQHAAEYLASNIGVNGSLRDIYDFFISLGFNKDLAWQRAARHKFGFIDTKQSGDILKPAMYFEYSQKVGALDKGEILKLFVGKVSIGQLDKINNYTGVIDEDTLKGYYNL